jgi:hypothetical protein
MSGVGCLGTAVYGTLERPTPENTGRLSREAKERGAESGGPRLDASSTARACTTPAMGSGPRVVGDHAPGREPTPANGRWQVGRSPRGEDVP